MKIRDISAYSDRWYLLDSECSFRVASFAFYIECRGDNDAHLDTSSDIDEYLFISSWFYYRIEISSLNYSSKTLDTLHTGLELAI